MILSNDIVKKVNRKHHKGGADQGGIVITLNEIVQGNDKLFDWTEETERVGEWSVRTDIMVNLGPRSNGRLQLIEFCLVNVVGQNSKELICHIYGGNSGNRAGE
jgi:hypothetical protein